MFLEAPPTENWAPPSVNVYRRRSTVYSRRSRVYSRRSRRKKSPGLDKINLLIMKDETKYKKIPN